MLGGDGSSFPRLQVCFALILCFISRKGGLSWRPDEVGPTAETHRPRSSVQGLGKWLTGERVLSLFLGGRDMPQEESIGELEESGVIPAPVSPARPQASSRLRPKATPARQANTYCQPWTQDSCADFFGKRSESLEAREAAPFPAAGCGCSPHPLASLISIPTGAGRR